MLPSHVVHKLSDHFGNYVICVTCRKCGHARDVTPHALARILGWEAELNKVIERFRCSRCHGKSVDVQIGFDRRQRRWNKNP